MKHNRLLGMNLALCAAAIPLTAGADVFPNGAQAQVVTMANPNTFSGSTNYTVTLGTTGGSSATDATGSSLAQVDLTTGLLKAATQGTSGPSATAQGYEFFTFSQAATIQYSLSINGTENNLDANGAIEVSPFVFVYQLNGTTPIFTSTSNGFEFISGGDIIQQSFHETDVLGSNFSSSLIGSGSNFTFIQSNDGSAIPVSFNITGSFNVDSTHVYAVLMDLSLGMLYSGGSHHVQQGADFSHTAAFNFTSLGGATYTSSSGQFLSAAPGVPEPSTLALCLGGVLIVIAARRCKP